MSTPKQPDQVFSVPNNDEGKYFIFLARKYLNRKSYQLRMRGRTPDHKKICRDLKIRPGDYRKRIFRQSLPQSYARNIGIYFNAKINGHLETIGIQSNIRLQEARDKYWRIAGSTNMINHRIDEIMVSMAEFIKKLGNQKFERGEP